MAKKLFGGKESVKEEMAEAKALKSGRISKSQYVAGEKSEGHGAGAAKKASAIKSGRLSPKAYAADEQKEGMKCGGKVKKMAGGGAVAMPKGKDMGSMNMKCGGKVKKMAFGGMSAAPAALGAVSNAIKNAPAVQQQMAAKQAALAKATTPSPVAQMQNKAAAMKLQAAPVQAKVAGIRAAMAPRGMAKGGGVETQGKTKGTTVKMARGGGIARKGLGRGKVC